MKRLLISVIGLVSLGACDSYQINETYRFYDSYSRPGRDFKNVVACLPHDPTKIMISDVERFKYDENAIHLLCREEEKPDYYILILPNAGGFDCSDETKTPAMDHAEYVTFCNNAGYPTLLTKKER